MTDCASDAVCSRYVTLQEKLKLVTVLGAGLLCGTALAVIIPEGVHALYEEILEGKVQHGSRLINMTRVY